MHKIVLNEHIEGITKVKPSLVKAHTFHQICGLKVPTSIQPLPMTASHHTHLNADLLCSAKHLRNCRDVTVTTDIHV